MQKHYINLTQESPTVPRTASDERNDFYHNNHVQTDYKYIYT